jgi:hypothetical protein
MHTNESFRKHCPKLLISGNLCCQQYKKFSVVDIVTSACRVHAAKIIKEDETA